MTRCECRERDCQPCRPVPQQTARWRVRVGTGEAGLLDLCAHCYINGHMWLAGFQYRESGHTNAPAVEAGALVPQQDL